MTELNQLQVFEKKLKLDCQSPNRVVQSVNALIRDGKIEAKQVFNVGGLEDVNVPTDFHEARLAAAAFAEEIVRDPYVNRDVAFARALERAKAFRNNKHYHFAFADDKALKNEKVNEQGVVIKSNGKIKKGGKQVLALQLFKTHVVEKSVSNQEFVAVLMKELDMTKAGATTYAYNTKKAYEKETGTTIEVKKAKKGRKAAPAKKVVKAKGRAKK